MAVFEPIIEALERGGVRYVIVGGVAVVLHGYARLTADLDLAIDLSPSECERALDVLQALGLRPTAPVEAGGLAELEIRRRWIREKGMRVFAMRDPDDPMRQVDLFTEDVVPFEELWARSEIIPLATTTARIAAIDDLIRMKELARRPQDAADIEALRAIAARRRSDG